jgi:nicotinate-nucleotide--dimethylbenzimidazole phosphoribosyltransferase
MALASDVLLAETIIAIGPLDEQAAAAAQAMLDAKTKPRGSLGRLEELACRVAAIRGTADLAPLRASVVVAASDHGSPPKASAPTRAR